MEYRTAAKTALPLVLVTWQLLAESPQKPNSLKDRARENGGRISYTLDVELTYASLADVIARADVIVRARIVKKVSGLSEDESLVRTYVTFNPSRIFKDKIGIDTVPPRQPAIPMIFVEPYGAVRVDGLLITQTSNGAADPKLKAGEEVLLFLKKHEELNAFRLQNGPSGLLRIEGQSVIEPNEEVASARKLTGKSVSEIEEEIERLVKTPADK